MVSIFLRMLNKIIGLRFSGGPFFFPGFGMGYRSPWTIIVYQTVISRMRDALPGSRQYPRWQVSMCSGKGTRETGGGVGWGGGVNEGATSANHCDQSVTEKSRQLFIFRCELMWNECWVLRQNRKVFMKSPQMIFNVKAPVCSDLDIHTHTHTQTNKNNNNQSLYRSRACQVGRI